MNKKAKPLSDFLTIKYSKVQIGNVIQLLQSDKFQPFIFYSSPYLPADLFYKNPGVMYHTKAFIFSFTDISMHNWPTFSKEK